MNVSEVRGECIESDLEGRVDPEVEKAVELREELERGMGENSQEVFLSREDDVKLVQRTRMQYELESEERNRVERVKLDEEFLEREYEKGIPLSAVYRSLEEIDGIPREFVDSVREKVMPLSEVDKLRRVKELDIGIDRSTLERTKEEYYKETLVSKLQEEFLLEEFSSKFGFLHERIKLYRLDPRKGFLRYVLGCKKKTKIASVWITGRKTYCYIEKLTYAKALNGILENLNKQLGYKYCGMDLGADCKLDIDGVVRGRYERIDLKDLKSG